MSELTEKIEDIITGEWGDNRSVSEVAAEIAAMIEAERTERLKDAREFENGLTAVGKILSDTAKKVNGLLAGEPSPTTNRDKAIKDAVMAMAGKYPDMPPYKPDTITVPEAVERLVNFFSEWDIYTTCILPDYWEIKIMLNGAKTTPPDYVMAIENGNRSDAAYRVGLEDLFVTILGGEK